MTGASALPSLALSDGACARNERTCEGADAEGVGSLFGAGASDLAFTLADGLRTRDETRALTVLGFFGTGSSATLSFSALVDRVWRLVLGFFGTGSFATLSLSALVDRLWRLVLV